MALATKYYYTYTDHLGSVMRVTNGSGTLLIDQSFDAWGRYRDANNWSVTDEVPSNALPWLQRGYTGHEMLPEAGLVNMNGRMYDPLIRRVLSVEL